MDNMPALHATLTISEDDLETLLMAVNTAIEDMQRVLATVERQSLKSATSIAETKDQIAAEVAALQALRKRLEDLEFT
jgi:septal ring factor EnvC (AmiA/AmiB activator)